MKPLKGACIIGQSGGPTAVINASAYGVIRTALDAGCITKVYGAAHGIKGVLDAKGIHAWVDFWGYDVDHDWGWWYKQVEYYLPFLLGKR